MPDPVGVGDPPRSDPLPYSHSRVTSMSMCVNYTITVLTSLLTPCIMLADWSAIATQDIVWRGWTVNITYYGSALPENISLGLQTRWPDAQIATGASIGSLGQVDALLVDLGEPGALDCIKAARASNDTLPIVGLLPPGDDFLTKMRAMRDGADAVEPSDVPALIVPYLLGAIIRRCRGEAADTLTVGPLAYDAGGMAWTLAGEPLRLTPTENKLLLALAQRGGKGGTRGALTVRGWGDTDGDSNLRKVAQRLRDKGVPLLTVPGVGYRLLTAKAA